MGPHEEDDPETCRWIRSGTIGGAPKVPIEAQGTYRFRIEAWIDTWATWHADLAKRVSAGQDVAVELREGATLVGGAARRARAAGAADDADRLRLPRPASSERKTPRQGRGRARDLTTSTS